MITVAVDAWNLVDDRRGMGRYVRRVLRDWENDPDVDVALIVRESAHVAAIARELPYRIARASTVKADAVWYPWNAMRFVVPRARTVVTLHDAFAFTLPHRELVARWREQMPIRRAIRKADALAVNSAWSARELSRVFAIDPARFTVAHPVPDPFWKPVETRTSEPYVLVVGGPDERKNLRTLFAAFAHAFSRGGVTLTIAGVLRDEDEQILAGAPFSFRRVWPDDEDLRVLYSGALAVAVPSSYEGYGLMAVEAMACGAPVIAADAAALPEACDGAATLLPPFDVDAWATTLHALADDAGLRMALHEESLARVARIGRLEPARITLDLLRGAATDKVSA